MTDPPDKYSPEEMDKILGRAIERSQKPDGIDHETMVEAAREVGISEQDLEAAERELRVEEARRSRRKARLLGVAGLAVLAVGGAVSLRAMTRKAADAEAARAPAAMAGPASCPSDMAAIPGGTYALGERLDAVSVRPYCLDRSEVTVGDYGSCASAGKCTEPDAYEAVPGQWKIFCNWRRAGRQSHPVNCVHWGQAVSYCASLGKRLPTEEEWEWAARNGPAATRYPWGDTSPDAQHLNACGAECPPNRAAKGFGVWTAMYPGDDGFTETAPVGSFPQGDNQWGVHDLAGNVYEWTASDFDTSRTTRIGRGAGWDERFAPSAEAAHREYARSPTFRSNVLGFRCAR
jgi:formylglycine-generating enzyme required for sulfatase activity